MAVRLPTDRGNIFRDGGTWRRMMVGKAMSGGVDRLCGAGSTTEVLPEVSWARWVLWIISVFQSVHGIGIGMNIII